MKCEIMIDLQEKFLSWLGELGISPQNPSDIIFDGKTRRYRTLDDKKGETSCKYAVHLDTPPNGWVRSFRHNIDAKWKPEFESHFTPQERREYAEKIEVQRIGREEEQARERARGIAKAREIWNVATEPNLNDRGTYLAKKGLSSGHGCRQLGKDIIVPLYNEFEELVNVQTIAPDGTKKFQYGAPKKGNFFIIGESCARKAKYVLICEGFSTGGTIHETTGCPVIVSFDCGNMAEVARKLSERYVGRLVIAADNDCGTVGNPGVSSGFKIADELGLPCIYPKFKDNELGSDWNDCFMIRGIEQTAEEIFSQLEEKDDPQEKKERSLIWVHSEMTKNGGLRIAPTKENLESLLSFYNISIFYDEVGREKRYILPPHLDNGSRFGADNRLNSILALIRSICEKHGYPTKNLEEFLALIADENRRHPVREWIGSCTWDGRERISELCETIQVAAWFPNDFKNTLILRWLISAVAAAFADGDFRTRGILVLQGRQRLGKTTFL